MTDFSIPNNLFNHRKIIALIGITFDPSKNKNEFRRRDSQAQNICHY